MQVGKARTGRGRQAEAARNDAAVVAAARTVFAEHGPDASVSLLADAAGVGVATLYRRFPTKDNLLHHLCRTSLSDQAAAVDDALTESDPALAVDRYVRRCVLLRVGAFNALAGRFQPEPGLVEASAAAHVRVEKLLERAQAAGQLRGDISGVDIHELISLFSRRKASDSSTYTRLLELAIAGLRPNGPALPGKPRAWEDYAAQWRNEGAPHSD